MSNKLYTNTSIWENYASESILKYRLPLISKLIPKDVKSIIDVGCGNGLITNELAKKYDVVGVDSSEKALEYVTCPTILSNITNINMKDASADLVLCSEVLEHLPNPILLQGIEQLKRLSKKYIFITVPNNEFLKKSHVQCDSCAHIFHATEHVNTFNAKNMEALFSDQYKMIYNCVEGPMSREYNPFLLRIKQHIGGVYYVPKNTITLCPNCENTQFSKQKSNIISKSTNLLNRIISKKKPYWLFCLFEKK